MYSYRMAVRRPLRRFSTCSFGEEHGNKLPSVVLDRLATQGVINPNQIQDKSLGPILDGGSEAAVINAETGSGKTLCYLLPIIKLFSELWRRYDHIPSPSALVLVPTPHLGHQVQTVYQSLVEPSWCSCLVHNGSRLTLTSMTSLVIATPTSLVQYDVRRVLKKVQMVCVDEADVLLTGSEREATWRVLETVRGHLRAHATRDAGEKIQSEDNLCSDYVRQDEHSVNMSENLQNSQASLRVDDQMRSHAQAAVCEADFQFVDNSLATVAPVNSPSHTDTEQTVRYIFTAATLPSGGRQTVSSRLKKWLPKNTLFFTTDLTHKLLPTANFTFTNVSSCEDASASGNDLSPNRKFTRKQSQLIQDLVDLHTTQTPPKVLVFCNSVSSAVHVHSFLARSSLTSELCTVTPWWTGRVGGLYKGKGGGFQKLQDTLRKFRDGEVCVLVCTDLGCRGLDLVDVTAVIQYDFPGNVANFLHRSGRTARAGKLGHVISYVDEGSEELANQIRDATESGEKTLERLFSRNKMLRRRLRGTRTGEKKTMSQ